MQSRTRPRSGARSVRSEDEALAREIALLARVERALRSGEPRLALALLDELDGNFPDAKLGHERTAARVLARCLLPAARERGSAEERAAQALAERFLREQPASVYGDRIRSACALEPVHERSATSKNSAVPDTQSEEVR